MASHMGCTPATYQIYRCALHTRLPQNGWVLRPLSADATERIDSAVTPLHIKASTEDAGSRVVHIRQKKDYIASCIRNCLNLIQ